MRTIISLSLRNSMSMLPEEITGRSRLISDESSLLSQKKSNGKALIMLLAACLRIAVACE